MYWAADLLWTLVQESRTINIDRNLKIGRYSENGEVATGS